MVNVGYVTIHDFFKAQIDSSRLQIVEWEPGNIRIKHDIANLLLRYTLVSSHVERAKGTVAFVVELHGELFSGPQLIATRFPHE